MFDNLIHQGEMPVTLGVFVAPGEPGRRNLRYDAFSDAYATFLLSELLPAVQSRYAITDNPGQWAIGGGSSGGSCAFTAAWMRPERIRRVLSPSGASPNCTAATVTPNLSGTPRKSRSVSSCKP